MARSWQYPRWRRVVMQVVLWAVFGATLGMAWLVVRHQRLAGLVRLTEPRFVELADGTRLGVRLPKGWAVQYGADEHEDATGGDGTAARKLFEVHELLGGTLGDDPADGPVDGRAMDLFCQRLATADPASTVLDRSPLLHGTRDLPAADADAPTGDADPTDGRLPFGGTDGAWRAVQVRVPMVPERWLPQYVAAGVLTGTRGSKWAVEIRLLCPGPPDPAGDREVLKQVAAGVVAVPMIHPATSR